MRLVELHRFVSDVWDAASLPSEATLFRWCEAGHLPARKVGGRWYVDADAWVDQGRKPSEIDLAVARLLKE